MVTLWIGDFRTKQLQNVYKAAQQTAEYHYLIEDQAEYSWFIKGALPQLQGITLESANLVVMLGLIDCVYSCVWASFKANKNNFCDSSLNFKNIKQPLSNNTMNIMI